MINLFAVVVFLSSLTVLVNFKSIFVILWTLIMVLCYSKWNSHFSMVLINLEFFTLIFLYLMFNLLSTTSINMSLVMLLTTALVMEACLGLSLLILLVRVQSKETLTSSLM